MLCIIYCFQNDIPPSNGNFSLNGGCAFLPSMSPNVLEAAAKNLNMACENHAVVDG